MVFTAKSNSYSNSSSNNEGWGMGFLLILFHHHPSNHEQEHPNSSPSSYKKKPSVYRSTSSSLLFSRTQSTLSICGILLFTTILLFTLATFELEPVNNVSGSGLGSDSSSGSRRMLRESGRKTLISFGNRMRKNKGSKSILTSARAHIAALQGMGALYLKGSKAMTDLVVAHVPEDVTEKEFRSFLRVIHHSGLLSRSDMVFIYASTSAAERFGELVKTECDSFLRLIQLVGELGRFTELGSGFSRYLIEVGKGENKESMWGMRRVNSSSEIELTRSSYGSVVGFEVSELDPEDTLSGFLDHVPMSLGRWAGYPMLLGRVRRQFKHMMLVDVKSTLILSEPFSQVRNRTSESLVLWSNHDAELPTRHHGKKNLGRTRDLNSKSQLNPSIIVGGSRGVRRFATAALTEIVRGVIEHKGKGRNSITESGIVNQLVHSGHLLKNINLIMSTEPLAELSSLGGLNSLNSGSGRNSTFLELSAYLSVVQRGQSGGGSGTSFGIDEAVMREICASHKLYSSVYSDCSAS